MRVLLWGTYDTSKPRTRILRAGMRAVGIEVHEIHATVWEGIEDKSQLKGWGSRLRILGRWMAAYPRLLWQLARTPKPDLLLIGYPGVLDAYLAVFIGRIRGIPVVWDVFISIYDTVVEDRRMLPSGSFAARLLRGIERNALRRVDLAFMDTRAHARRVESLFGLPSDSCGAVWVGTETEHFSTDLQPAPREPDAPLKILFYGQFIPLHGIATIVEAARITRDLPVEWTLIGRGQEAGRIRDLLAADPLPNVQWIEWVDYNNLRHWMTAADLCLGIFGDSQKAASVIPNKVFQIVAAGRPLITRDSPAIREWMQHCPVCVYLVPAASPLELANAVREHLATDNWKHGISCHGEYRAMIDHKAIGTQFLELLHHSKLADRADRHD